ncbi:hypothetical protein P3T36_001729 [Kitasatospora sp. MAP12-15]|uniref:hypothetical protein n=1 Tax=unclassified Kitasatospora TaxID=2633591 RepID=UPI0024756EF1|nr:hypothetical protein [Kitasatospora sp. MAP12-44]MDH6113392.1 hypothetical protein [Kitasatospora sp. MAP12-44]
MINGNALPVPGWDGGNGNSAYLDKTLRHQPVEVQLDDRVSGRTVWRLLARASVVAAIAFAVQLPFAIASLVAAFSGSGDGYGGDSVSSGLGGFGLILIYDSPLVFLLVLLFSRLTEPIGEWRVLLHDRTEQDVQSTYHKICGVLRYRNFPLQVNFRRLETGIGAQQSNGRLTLAAGDCQATISVFRYGDSMYLGWQMWRTRRGWQLIARFLGDVLGSIFGRSDLAWAMLRTENIRAMREAVHAVCREGLVTAIEREQVPAAFGFPTSAPPLVERRPAPPAGPVAPVPYGQPLERARAQAPSPHAPSPHAPAAHAPAAHGPSPHTLVAPAAPAPSPTAPVAQPPSGPPRRPAGPPTVGDGWASGASEQ